MVLHVGFINNKSKVAIKTIKKPSIIEGFLIWKKIIYCFNTL